MPGLYDPDRLLARARAWRMAAETAKPIMRHLYLSLATKAENRVKRSLDTPSVRDRKRKRTDAPE